jgi:hypothetical protein
LKFSDGGSWNMACSGSFEWIEFSNRSKKNMQLLVCGISPSGKELLVAEQL